MDPGLAGLLGRRATRSKQPFLVTFFRASPGPGRAPRAARPLKRRPPKKTNELPHANKLPGIFGEAQGGPGATLEGTEPSAPSVGSGRGVSPHPGTALWTGLCHPPAAPKPLPCPSLTPRSAFWALPWLPGAFSRSLPQNQVPLPPGSTAPGDPAGCTIVYGKAPHQTEPLRIRSGPALPCCPPFLHGESALWPL